MSTAPIFGSPTTSPRLSPTELSSASTADITARDLLRTSPASSAPPLTGTELYDFNGKYQEARQLLTANNPPGARALFLEILEELVIEGDNDPDLIFRADCKIGIAYAYSTSEENRNVFALEAKKDLDLAFANYKSWQTDDPALITRCFQWLEAFYGQFEHLLPHAEPAFKKEIQEKLKECRKILGIPSPSLSPEISRLKPRRLRTTPPRKLSRTVTPGPVDDSWKKTKLVFAFAFAGVVLASFAMFIRRLITRIN